MKSFMFKMRIHTIVTLILLFNVSFMALPSFVRGENDEPSHKNGILVSDPNLADDPELLAELEIGIGYLSYLIRYVIQALPSFVLGENDEPSHKNGILVSDPNLADDPELLAALEIFDGMLDEESAGGDEIDHLSGTDSRKVTFELSQLMGSTSTNGVIVIQTRPDWAPLGVAQFHEMVETEFFNQCRFFRVVPDFMIQFGISGDPAVSSVWRKKVIKDDPVNNSNVRGIVTFAMSGPNTRTSQLFINTAKNSFLDKQGFSPIGEVISGMDSVDQIQTKYREKPDQGSIQNQGNEYLNGNFPDLSFISNAYFS